MQASGTVLVEPSPRNPVDTVGVFVVFVVAELVLDKKENQNAGSHPDRQPEDIDQNECGALFEVPDEDFEVVGEHGCLLVRLVCCSAIRYWLLSYWLLDGSA